MKTARHAPMATISSPFPFYAMKIAVSSPAAAEIMLPVAYRIAGKVIADRTVYGI